MCVYSWSESDATCKYMYTLVHCIVRHSKESSIQTIAAIIFTHTSSEVFSGVGVACPLCAACSLGHGEEVGVVTVVDWASTGSDSRQRLTNRCNL